MVAEDPDHGSVLAEMFGSNLLRPLRGAFLNLIVEAEVNWRRRRVGTLISDLFGRYLQFSSNLASLVKLGRRGLGYRLGRLLRSRPRAHRLGIKGHNGKSQPHRSQMGEATSS